MTLSLNHEPIYSSSDPLLDLSSWRLCGLYIGRYLDLDSNTSIDIRKCVLNRIRHSILLRRYWAPRLAIALVPSSICNKDQVVTWETLRLKQRCIGHAGPLSIRRITRDLCINPMFCFCMSLICESSISYHAVKFILTTCLTPTVAVMKPRLQVLRNSLHSSMLENSRRPKDMIAQSSFNWREHYHLLATL